MARAPTPAAPARLGGLVCVCVILAAAFALGRPSETQRAAEWATSVERGLGALGLGALGTGASLRAVGLPRSAEYLTRAKEDLSEGRLDAALMHLHQALEVHGQQRPPENTAESAHAAQLGEIEFLLGEAYFRAGQPYSAYRHLWIVAERATEPGYRPFAAGAVARLVDAAFAAENLELLPRLEALIENLHRSDPSDALAYAKAKLCFAFGRHKEALDLASTIRSQDLTGKRALYLRGAALARLARSGPTPDFSAAIAEFERAIAVVAAEDPAASREIGDLSRMAVARLHYEAMRYDAAVAVFSRIDSTSPQFGTALFEMAWAYAQLGDFERAEQTLASLSVLDPGLIDGAEAALLRAEMRLRSGHFREAEVLYLRTLRTYDPLRQDLDDFLARHARAAEYYEKLVKSDLELGQELSKPLMDLVREEARGNRLFAFVDEVTRSERLIAESRRFAGAAEVVSSSGVVRLFPDLAARFEQVLVLSARLSQARLELARGLDHHAGGATGELAVVRSERRQLMNAVELLPTTSQALELRASKGVVQWNPVGQTLQRLELEVDRIQALCNGLRRLLADVSAQRIAITEEARRRYRDDLAVGEAEIVRYRRQIAELRQAQSFGKLEYGVGDAVAREDERTADRFRAAFVREWQLTLSGRDPSGKAQKFASESRVLFERVQRLSAKLDRERTALAAETQARASEVAEILSRETTAIEAHHAALEALAAEQAEALGEAARGTFVAVRDRLVRIVRRAELGLSQKSFEVREEHRRRVDRLKRERSREIKIIEDDLAEVMGESKEAP